MYRCLEAAKPIMRLKHGIWQLDDSTTFLRQIRDLSLHGVWSGDISPYLYLATPHHIITHYLDLSRITTTRHYYLLLQALITSLPLTGAAKIVNRSSESSVKGMMTLSCGFLIECQSEKSEVGLPGSLGRVQGLGEYGQQLLQVASTAIS